MRHEHRERASAEVVCRVVSESLEAAAEKRGPTVEEILHDTIYEERKRLEREPRKNPRREQDQAFIEDLRRRALHAGPEEHRVLLRELCSYFVGEIVGNFNPRVYGVATQIVPRGLALLLNALSPTKLARTLPELPSLETNVHIRGEVETLRRLQQLGTVVLCPTHSSNLDSPIVGWALFAMGLPPFLYGAGINLFTNPALSFFMHNLGAYRVDRRKKSELYKDVLKAYCQVSLELGYNNLFFPGGTRSRSGAIEPKLKLGLLGCGVRAYVENLLAKRKKPRIFCVPCTLSYGLVLEAETLIDDYLKEAGKARYIIEDDESSRIGAWLRFLSGVVSMDSRLYLTISEPLDLFGNRVEADGVSYDRRGRPIDTTRYVLRGDRPVHDANRDAEYTRECADGILAAFHRDNVLQATNLLAFTQFELMRRRRPEDNLYRLLRGGRETGTLPYREVAEALDRVMARVTELSDGCKVRLDPRLRGLGAAGVIDDALRLFASYHQKAAVTREGDHLVALDGNLVFFYRNRATGYGLEDRVAESPAPPAVDLKRRPSGDPLWPSDDGPAPKPLREPEHEVAAPAGGAR